MSNFKKYTKSTQVNPPKMLFLELGCVPFRELIKKRRISFLHYILNENQDSMMYKFLQSQLKNKRPRDWITLVLKDIDDLKQNISLEELKEIKKPTLKKNLNKTVLEEAFERLNKMKENHSKVRHIKHYKLEMQKYLKSSKLIMKQEEAQTVFSLRCRMTDVKINYKGSYETLHVKFVKKKMSHKNI